MLKIMTGLLLIVGTMAWAQPKPGHKAAAGGPGPCAQIENDCKKNGYIAGEAGKGKGLWIDCLCPLIGQNFPEPSKNVLTVPSDANLVPACRNHPAGQKIMQNCAQMLAKQNAKGNAKSAKPASKTQ